MYREVSKLILYRNLGEDSILRRLSDIFKRFDSCHYRSEELITDIYREVKSCWIWPPPMVLTRTCGIII